MDHVTSIDQSDGYKSKNAKKSHFENKSDSEFGVL